MDRQRTTRSNRLSLSKLIDNGDKHSETKDALIILSSSKSSKVALSENNFLPSVSSVTSKQKTKSVKSPKNVVMSVEQSKNTVSKEIVSHTLHKIRLDGERNVARHQQYLSLGLSQKKHMHQHAASIVANEVNNFELWKVTSPFERRSTCLSWHPYNNSVVAVGSKFGDTYIWDLNSASNDAIITGGGPGNVVTDCCFLRETCGSCRVVMTSMDGTVSIKDLRTGAEERLSGEKFWSCERWPCSMDITKNCDAVVSGDSKGYVDFVTLSAEKVWSHRLHKAKVNHIEFHPNISWLFCTASTDKTVALWDLRMIKGKQDSIAQLTCDMGVASASFSPTSGGQRLLVTDQHHSLKVYLCGSWTLEKEFIHPHRHFQHLTPIKASWHPLEDLIVCARYPDPALPGQQVDDMRGIDIFSMTCDQRVGHLFDPSAAQIISRTKFNSDGSLLAATMGTSLLILKKPEHEHLRSDTATTEGCSTTRLLYPESSADRNNNRARRQTNKKKVQTTRETAELTKKKLKE